MTSQRDAVKLSAPNLHNHALSDDRVDHARRRLVHEALVLVSELLAAPIAPRVHLALT